ncbi:MAG: glycosyltransferase family 9 protein [Planctomycetaceae bacterium]|nr:glycosyltransferase family 9 protein [Planctomycetaceae bacterium]
MNRIPAESLKSLKPRRICLIKPSALGDVVQSVPLLPVLKQCYPDAEISWVINKSFANLLQDHPLIDELLIFDRHGSWRSWGRLLKQLRSRQFDLVIDLQGLLRTGVMTLATGAKTRVGLETAREGSHFTTNCTIPDSSREIPAHARNWRLAEVLGCQEADRKTLLKVHETETQWARETLSSLSGPVLTISPGAQWVTKRWPVEKYAEVARRAVREHQFGICIVGGPNEVELCRPLERQIRQQIPHVNLVNVAGRTTLKQLTAILQETDLMLCNDSGPMHLAAGVGTPVVGIFLCTDSIRSGPPGDQHRLVSTSVACRASYKKQCPCEGDAHLACLRELEVERVWSAFQSCLNHNQILPSDAA